MLFGPASNLVVGLALAIFVGIGLVVSFSHYADFGDLCGAQENGPECFRNWMAASAGYVAAGFAALTIFALFRQIAEQKKQTDFLLGDGLPTIDAIQHQHDPQSVVVRVVNWNRRPIVVLGVTIPANEFTTRLKQIRMYDREHPEAGFKGRVLHQGSLVPPIPMHGWKNRAGGPCEIRIDLQAIAAEGHYADWNGAEVIVEAVIAGDKNSTVKLACFITTAD